jgi:Luciferase-like monooxygenase
MPAYDAAQTIRITLGTSVLEALFQSSIIFAPRLATLDRLSDGRLVVGVGQGWMEQEFEAAGVSMKRRGAGFEEHIPGHANGLEETLPERVDQVFDSLPRLSMICRSHQSEYVCSGGLGW